MNSLICHMLLVVFCFACNAKPKEKTTTVQNDTLTIPSDSATIYFPFRTYSDEDLKNSEREMNSFYLGFYSKMLYALHEPILYTYSGNNEIYRFTWLRTFDNPVTIRVQKDQDNIQLIAKISNGQGGYEPGEIIHDTSFIVSRMQWNTLKNLTDSATFWSLPTQNNTVGRDGANWIVEGIHNKKYHWVNRWSPRESNNDYFRKLCMYLIAISKINIKADHIY